MSFDKAHLLLDVILKSTGVPEAAAIRNAAIKALKELDREVTAPAPAAPQGYLERQMAEGAEGEKNHQERLRRAAERATNGS